MPASASAPAIQDRSPERSLATTNTSYVPGRVPSKWTALTSLAPTAGAIVA